MTAPGGLVGCPGLICRCCGAQQIYFNQHSFTRNIQQHLIWFLQSASRLSNRKLHENRFVRWDFDRARNRMCICLFVRLSVSMCMIKSRTTITFIFPNRAQCLIYHFNLDFSFFTHFASFLTSFGRKRIRFLLGLHTGHFKDISRFCQAPGSV